LGDARGRRTGLSTKQAIVKLVDTAVENGCRQSVACEELGLAEKTFKRWVNNNDDQRRGPLTVPSNKLSEEERSEILTTVNSEAYQDLAPCQIVPRLADKGIYLASESTFYRVLKSEGQLAHRGKSKPATKKKPDELMATRPNQVYSWDITYLKSPIKGSFYYLYMFLDIFSRKIVGWEVHENESMVKSSKLIQKIHLSEGLAKGDVKLHSDNGGPMKGATMLATLQNLGIVPSFSRPCVSNDNPYSESLFKTVKYRPEFPSQAFKSIEAARTWVASFVQWYNCEHLHSGIKFVTPMSRHKGGDVEVLEKRKIVYEEAKNKNPNRWSGKTRNWGRPEKVYLNCLPKEEVLDIKIAS